MLDYDGFKNFIEANLINHLPDKYQDASVVFESVLKNNGKVLDGVFIKGNGIGTCPIIYLDEYFEQHVAGRPIFDICDSIGEKMVFHLQRLPFDDVCKLLDNVDFVKSHIVMRLVNAERNEGMLSSMPHRYMEDLSVFYCVELPLDGMDGNVATAKINNDLMGRLGLDEQSLYNLAFVNSNHLHPASVRTMFDTLKEMMGDEFGMSMPGFNPTESFYVISNDSRIQGSSVIVYSDCLKQLSDQLGSDLFVLPSSIHEVLALPAEPGNGVDPEDLIDMVKMVNTTQVAPDEVLSDNVYKYDSKTQKLSLVSEEKQEQQLKEETKRAPMAARAHHR